MAKSIQSFGTLEELLNEIRSDKNSQSIYAHRFPIRFIFLPELRCLKELVKNLNEIGVDIIELADVLPNDDGWLTSDQIIDVITQRDKEKDLIIVPFSEVARFYSKNDFIAVLNSLTEIENVENTKRRVYIPFIGLYERFEKKFLKAFSRRAEWAPIWKLSENHEKRSTIKIYLIHFAAPDIKDIKLIKNVKEWLNVWKTGDVEKMVCCSNTLSYHYKNTLPDQVFDIEQIDNYKNFILNIFDIDIPIPYGEDEKELWGSLLNNILVERNIKNFSRLVATHFNRASINKEEIIDLWLEKNDNLSRWFLKWWVVNETSWKENYIHLVMDDIGNFTNDEFLNKLWFKIFGHDRINKSWIRERKDYLKRFHSKSDISLDRIEAGLQDILTSVLSNKDKIGEILELLTDITTYERKYLIEIIKGNKNSYLDIIRGTYPHLYYYLQSIVVDNLEKKGWVKEYFDEYKYSKMTNSPSDKLQEILAEKNKDEDSFYNWYYSIEDPQSIVKKEEAEEIILMDGMGLEWLSLFVKLIEKYSEQYGIFVEKEYVARTNLPTVTECNRFENAKHVRDLDNFIHSENPYRYPDDLIKEIELIDEVIRREILSSNKSKILVVSDHGFTVFPQSQFENIKKYNFKESNHEGRCMWTDETFSADEDFILHTPDECGKGKKRLVSLRYASLYHLPRREVHGGATPEEVLVPVILVSKTKEEISYEIGPLHQEISIRSPNLYLAITPKPQIAPILIYEAKNLVRELKYDTKENKWWTQLRGFNAGSYIFHLKIGGSENKISVEIKGGLKERELL